MGKPCLVVDAELATATEAAVLMAVFVLRHRVAALNVAGPRASGQPHIYAFAFDAVGRLLRRPGGGGGDFPVRVRAGRPLYSVVPRGAAARCPTRSLTSR